jgi:hypothetical protein
MKAHFCVVNWVQYPTFWYGLGRGSLEAYFIRLVGLNTDDCSFKQKEKRQSIFTYYKHLESKLRRILLKDFYHTMITMHFVVDAEHQLFTVFALTCSTMYSVQYTVQKTVAVGIQQMSAMVYSSCWYTANVSYGIQQLLVYSKCQLWYTAAVDIHQMSAMIYSSC